MYQNDYILRQIEMFANFIANLLDHKDSQIDEVVEYKDAVSDGMLLERTLLNLVEKGEINRAEDLLFEKLEQSPSADYLKAAVSFYKELSKMDNITLEKNNFSKDEILEGLYDIKKIYKIEDINIS